MTNLDQTRMYHHDLAERFFNGLHSSDIRSDHMITYCWTEYVYGYAKGPDDPMPIIF